MKVASVASEYTGRECELESGFVEAMESQGDAVELSASSKHLAQASVLQTASEAICGCRSHGITNKQVF